MARKSVDKLPAHSPLGFSGAERYMVCPGSVALNMSLPPDTTADPEYRRKGEAAHAAAAVCLQEEFDAWEIMDRDFELTAADLDAIQVYLDHVRDLRIAGGRQYYEELIEVKIHAPKLHEQAFGTLDYCLVLSDKTCIIRDYKHGEGVFVEAERNPQLMGYAAMMLERYPWIVAFDLGIVQPRFQGEQKIRTWQVWADEIAEWRDNELKPAMRNAWSMTKGKPPVYQPGEHCRFCPAKNALACPALKHEVAVVEQSAPLVERISDEKLADLYAKVEPLKMMIKAIEAETTRRALAGIKLPGVKVVPKKAFRVWKSDAPLTEEFGPAAYVETLRSPAEIEKEFGREGKEFVRQWAFTPDNGYTIAPESDRRKAIEVQKPSETFTNVLTAAGLIE